MHGFVAFEAAESREVIVDLMMAASSVKSEKVVAGSRDKKGDIVLSFAASARHFFLTMVV